MASPRDNERIKKFSNWFKQAMSDKGFKSQRQFAIASTVSSATISRICNYSQLPDDEVIIKIAAALEMPVKDVMLMAGYPVSDSESFYPEQKKPKDLMRFLEQSEVMFDGVPVTEEDKAKIKAALEVVFWDAKQRNKRNKS